MDASDLLASLKIASAIIAAVLGVCGVLFDFRNKKTKRLSPAGKAVVAGIFISTIIAVMTSTMEVYKDRRSSSEQAQRTEQLLREIARTIEPITRLDVSFSLLLPAEHPAIGEYISYLRSQLDERISELTALPPSNKKRNKGISVPSITSGGEPITIRIKKESALWPRPGSPLFFPLLSYSLSLFIRSEPTKVDSFRPVMGAFTADFSAGAVFPDDIALEWRPDRSKLYMTGKLKFPKTLWYTNGKISSMQDLYGSQLIVIPPGSSMYNLPERYKKFRNLTAENIMKGLEVRLFRFEFSEGKGFWIPGSKLEKTPYAGGYPALSIILPKDFDGLQKLGENIDNE